MGLLLSGITVFHTKEMLLLEFSFPINFTKVLLFIMVLIFIILQYSVNHPKALFSKLKHWGIKMTYKWLFWSMYILIFSSSFFPCFAIQQECKNFLCCLTFKHQLSFVVAQLPSHVRQSATPWTAAGQTSLSFTVFQSLLKLMLTESMMPSNHLILCHPLLMFSIFPSIRVFSNESHQVAKVLELLIQYQSS